MSEDFKVVAFQLTSNMEVELHSQEELEHLAKRHVISKQCVNYNQQLDYWLTDFRVDRDEGFKARLKKFKKELEKIGELNKVDRMAILNNRFANEAELLLKVPACQHVPSKDRKAILEGQLS